MKKFSLFCWNVHNLIPEQTDVSKVIQHIKRFNPDIFALFEVVGSDAWRHLFKEFPQHSFFITEGEQTQEILIGVPRTLKIFYTQRDEFKSGRTALRPGAFVTFEIDREIYTLLFLHLKSANDPEGFGLRDDMLEHVYNLKGALDRAAGGSGKANFIVMGDLNTMGLNYHYSHDIAAEVEIDHMRYRSNWRKMNHLNKSNPFTWSNGKDMFSDLDHVLASQQIQFQKWDSAHIKVGGWNELPSNSPEFRTFIETVSDHCSLYCEVLGPPFDR